MVMITGLLRDATGQPLTTPLSITLTDYGVATPSTLYLPAKLTVIPDVNGDFSVDLWANQSSAHPCLYRVETPQGSSFLISVPGGELGPLDIGNLVVTKADLKADTNILNRLARLESNGGGTGGGGSILTLGDGLTGGGYDGSQPVTATVSSTIARVNSPTFTSPRSNAPPLGDNSTLLATTSWAGNAANLTQGTLPSSRLPSNLAATTAQRLATPRTILGTPFDGTADIPPLTLGLGLVAPNASSLNIDFNVVASASDTRFTNSREWSATTITQLEAEGGTDTTRRAWSAQRVRQSITAWWAGVEGTLARLVSPAFSGTPTAPTAPSGDASTRLATTAFSSNANNLTSGTVPITRIPTLNQNTTGVSASAAKLTTPRSILGFPFDGTADLPLALGNGVVVTNGVLGVDFGEVASVGSLSSYYPFQGYTGTSPDAYLSGIRGGDLDIGTGLGGWHFITSLRSNLSSWGVQLALSDTSNNLRYRRKVDNVWGSWSQIANLSENQTFLGFIGLGAGNTELKCKVLTSTTAATEGGQITIAHGLDGSKIVNISGVIYLAAEVTVPSPGNQPVYQSWVSTSATNINVTNVTGSSAGLLSKVCKYTIWYTA